MGIPSFFRWLQKKYPRIVTHCERKNSEDDTCDNLYLDFNGIIHPCCHPENKPAPKDEEEMMISIFNYIDRIINIIRPRKVLYIAIDGVAPRAKLNQQRCKRYRASKEYIEKNDLIISLRKKLLQKGKNLPPAKAKPFDSSCIKPGTIFMSRMVQCLDFYIHDRLNKDPRWKDIEVILSDSNVPGEGEHKIMDFMRHQKSSPNYNVKATHCIYGADADLILLGLATHEENVIIIREKVVPYQQLCEFCRQFGHELKDCTGAVIEKQGEVVEVAQPELNVEFILVKLKILQEHLSKELAISNLPFPFILQRAIDDFVCLCLFVGNDFLPQLPSLEIREGAIERLIDLYKRTVFRTGGYLTDVGEVDLNKLQFMMHELSEVEDDIFKKRYNAEVAFKLRQQEKNKKIKLTSLMAVPYPINSLSTDAYQQIHITSPSTSHGSRIRYEYRTSIETPVTGYKRKEYEDPKEPQDDIRLWETGYKGRYYASKFHVDEGDISFRNEVAMAYTEGLCWVVKYFYQGVQSWSWYYPFHYGPFASDFDNIAHMKMPFEIGEPFSPFEQLMAVFPPALKSYLPVEWQKLMCEPESPIIEFYPTTFETDKNGKKFEWQGTTLLPFIDEKKLFKALESVYESLTEEERYRNRRNKEILYVGINHRGYQFLKNLYELGSNWELTITLNPSLFYIANLEPVILSEDETQSKDVVCSPLKSFQDITENHVVCVQFLDKN